MVAGGPPDLYIMGSLKITLHPPPPPNKLHHEEVMADAVELSHSVTLLGLEKE